MAGFIGKGKTLSDFFIQLCAAVPIPPSAFFRLLEITEYVILNSSLLYETEKQNC